MKNWKMIRFYIITAIIFFIFAILLLGYFPISFRVKKEVAGIIWSLENEEYSEPVTISIDGKYKKYIFPLFKNRSNNAFSGYITIYINEIEEKFQIANAQFLRYNYNQASMAYYNPYTNNVGHLGYMWEDKKMSSAVIILSESDVNGISKRIKETEAYISYPATNRDEAFTIADGFWRENSWLIYTKHLEGGQE